MATLTMLVSRTDMNIPTISTTSGSPQAAPAPGVPTAPPVGRAARGRLTSGFASALVIDSAARLGRTPPTRTWRRLIASCN